MNKWKNAFFILASIVVAAIILIVYWLLSPLEKATLLDEVYPYPEGSVLQVKTTVPEFEAVARKYLADAIKDSPIDVQIAIDDQIYFFSELIIFGIHIPIQMDFDPIVDQGNIKLKQTEVHIGKLNIPPSSVLSILRDSVKFPSWIIVQPKEEQIYVDLSRLIIADGNRVRATKIDLKNEQIELEIVIPVK